ncbi:putative G-type lectin S-receptor-like serine/threonine-protein kinase At1g61610 isoform X2 [Camellia sinensis]|uniref:putative G-type lectin S-receptor-like serine/threonine-protein kinase At1g61610 isoform X2 n=1 Tax=Camellia sinensis TaxID=4442 RepID=UPI001036EA89|nr:putative G-type lectin S-receptor-like serine/threonine-protein kinase At1g61610 isoform X2 [Camellia sinensis]
MGTSTTASVFCWTLFYLCSLLCHAANNIITQGQLIRDGETILSASQNFVLGFFSPGNSTYRYVGIWYYKIPIQSIVWVANRNNPISGKNGSLKIGNKSNLLVLDGNGNSVWSSNASAISNDVTAILMDTGNLVLSSSDSVDDLNKALWQSFNEPTDTFLPGMTVYMNVRAGETRVFTSWTSDNDPSLGRYSMGVDPQGSPQIVIWDGLNRHWRSGHWNGLIFTGVPTMRAIYLYGFKLFNEGNGSLYFTYTSSNSSDPLRFRIGWDGNEAQLWWDDGKKEWRIMQLQPANECEVYNKCGNFGKCNVMDSTICSCMKGFVPKNVDQWDSGNWSGGCVRKTQLQCGTNGEEDGFVKIEGVKLPDYADLMVAQDIGDCGEKCSKNCSCHAYTFAIGISCMIWRGDLVDIQHFEEGGSDLYVRLASSDLISKRKFSKLVIIVHVLMGTFFISISIWLLWRFRAKLKALSNLWWKKNQLPTIDARRSRDFSRDNSGPDELGIEGQQRTGPELSLFSFSDVAAATDNFSEENKLGKGGFGPVYKGNLYEGEEIAVKRLSRKSGQGLEEFKNEIILIAKLQHRNLVRLLGCCIEGEERMLIYEYMPNKSLDSFIFDPIKRALLDWRKRFTIVEGIARGLLYLHRDSRLRIIHRDLKASNILLDEEMIPKISDFGMAKIFGRNESEASTSRVVGTYGYMAPEYAMDGLFSVKSDVYSFGVLLLEIVSGRRNNSFRSSEYPNIIGYAWDLWEGDRAMELIDPSIESSCCQNEVLRCIHVAMLCVQDSAIHRPTMSSLVLTLESENATLPMPRQPTFTSMRSSGDIDMWKDNQEIASPNDLTISVILGR